MPHVDNWPIKISIRMQFIIHFFVAISSNIRGYMLRFTSIFFVLMMGSFHMLKGQNSNGQIIASDSNYIPTVRSIYFQDVNSTLSLPIFYLDSVYQFNIHFDLLENKPRRISYSLLLYDRNWNPVDLDPLEYLEGINEQLITNYKSSQLTLVPYIHYTINFPSTELNLKSTGNYLLIVYDEDENVLFTRKIYVAQNRFRVDVKFVSAADIAKYYSHQAIEMNITAPYPYKVLNPLQELQVEIFQNGNPNTRIILKEPFNYSSDKFNYVRKDEIIFPAMKEYRYKDIRSVQQKTFGISYWDERDGKYNCYFVPDEIRADRNYFSDIDINGRFYISKNDVEYARDNYIKEYVWCYPSIKTSRHDEREVYIYGALSDWKLKDEFKMTYDESKRAYLGSFLFKNSYFNYMYATLDDQGNISTSEFEGDWYETENDYFVLVYYKGFGDRNDRIVFAGRFTSN